MSRPWPAPPARRRWRAGAALLVVAPAAGVPLALAQSSPSGHTSQVASTRQVPGSASGPIAGEPGSSGATGTTGATGPAIATDLPCYLQNRGVVLSGSGFTSGAHYAVALDGAQVGGGTVASDGSVSGRLASGRVVAGATHLKHAVVLSDGNHSATTSFYVTQFSAAFDPATGNPATLLVRYSVWGFGIGPAAPLDPTPREVFLHYVSPSGKTGFYVDLGRTHGFCGSIPSTRRHHLFPFSPLRGLWRLQFDLSRAYSPSASPRVVVRVRVG